MSPNINSFVGDLVAMAQAMEELPKAQAMIEDLRRQLDEAQRHNQGLEQNILGYKSDINGLNQRLADTSKAKDDIELKLMEMEDRNNAVSRFLGSFMGEANSLRNAIDPPKPEPTPEPMSPPPSAEVAVMDQVQSSGEHPAPNSDHAPTVQETHAVENQSWHSTDVGQSSAPPPVDPPSQAAGKYSGLMYQDYPSWVSRQDWIEGGGTGETYDYRRNHANSL
jgi:hypothetical protein